MAQLKQPSEQTSQEYDAQSNASPPPKGHKYGHKIQSFIRI